MSAYALLFGKFNPQGWTNATKLELCMEFIDNMGVDASFNDFLVNKVYEENFDSLEEKLDEEEIE